MFRTRADGLIVDWNPEAEQLTGIAAADAEGRPCWDVIVGRDGAGGILCHKACSLLRLAREGWPVHSLDICARTPRGPSRLTLSTIVLQEDDGAEIIHVIQPTADSVRSPAQDRQQSLTRRQREILGLLAEGVRAKEIAARLTLSETTVRNHIHAILLALGVHSQLEAVARAHTLARRDDEAAG